MTFHKERSYDQDERISSSAFMAVNLSMFSAGMQYMLVFPIALPITRLLTESYDSDFVEEHKGAFMSLLVTLPYFTGAIGCIIWGYFSDRFGRRPVMLISLSGALIAMLLCAFSTTYLQFAIGRGLSGLLDATLFISKAIVGDSTTSRTQARRFSDIMACFAISLAVSPSFAFLLDIGSTTMPVLLPCGIGALLIALSLFSFWLFVPETLEKTSKPQSITTTKDVIQRDYDAVHSVCLFALLASGLFASEALVPLIMTEKISAGGLGYKRSDVIIVLIVQGVFYVLAQKFLYCRLARVFGGPIRSFGFGALALSILCPSSYIPTLFVQNISWPKPLFLMCVIVAIRIVCIALTLTSAIEIVNNSSLPAHRGKTNAAAQCMASSMRSVLGVSIGYVYDVSRRSGHIGMPFCAIGVLMILCVAYADFILPASLNIAKNEMSEPSKIGGEYRCNMTSSSSPAACSSGFTFTTSEM